ncbi:MAG: YebC/PmpR family DNA-binding transcriptional regulator, partial [Patescibacteria group bacterium]
MAGHSHWKQIKVQKGAADQKRGRVFSKLLAAVSIAAKSEANPQFNPRLRAAVAKAKENQVPQENIDRAIKKASEKNENLEEIRMECYGPGGAAIIAEAITDNSN